MRTLSRLIRRNILSAFGIVLLIFIVNLSLFLAVTIYFGLKREDYIPIRRFADAFSQASDGTILLDPAMDWHTQFEWAMLLDDTGQILWSELLPQNLNHPYSVPEVASFSRWYLNDYPVMVYRNDYGLLVGGLPRDSLSRFNFYIDQEILRVFISGFIPLLLLDVGLILMACLLLGWLAARPLRDAAEAIELLAEGKSIHVKETGSIAELAEKLNRTSERLQRQAALIAQRDAARTNWISGVSHDLRTPLSLIMGNAEQLEHAASLHDKERRNAISIRIQSQKIKTLIEELNLTSKLTYNAQPLHLREIPIGSMLRQCLANFCDTCDALDQIYELDISISEELDRLTMFLDTDLITRSIDNLLNNSVRHNPKGCEIIVSAIYTENAMKLTIRDNGVGYPPVVLHTLRGQDKQEFANEPHILGLYLVKQIAEAHGGNVQFFNDNGAVAILSIPLKK